MIRAGKLDRMITIERLTETVTPSGSVLKAWAAIASLRAELIQQSAEEFLAGPGEVENTTVIFRTRWMDGITTADRLIYNGKPHDLKEIAEMGRRRGLELRGKAQ